MTSSSSESSKSPQSEDTPQRSCPSCGHQNAAEAHECSECGHVFAAPSRGVYVVQIALFALVLSIALYPYVKRAFPPLERLIEPGVFLQRIGDAHFRQQRWKKALSYYQKASQKRGLHTYILTRGYERQQALMHYKMAICAMRLKRSNEAIKYAATASKKAPKWMLPFEVLAQLHSLKRAKSPFEANARDMKRRFARHKNTWLVLGNGYARLGMHQRALDTYQAGLQLFPGDIQLLTNMAWELLRSPKTTKEILAKALSAAKEAVKRSQRQDFVALDTLARVHWEARQFAAAQHAQEDAVARAKQLMREAQKQPRSIRTQSLTLALARMKRRLAKYKRAVALNPSGGSAARPAATRHPATRPAGRVSPPVLARLPQSRLQHLQRPAVPAPTSLPAARPASRPVAPTSRPVIPLFRPLPRLFKGRAPVPRDPRHKRSRQLLLPE